MGNHLAIRMPSSRAVGAHAQRSQPASSLSTEGLEFNERALGWHDLPTTAHKLAPDAGVLGEAVVQLPGARKLADGRLVQERIGYRAGVDRIAIVHTERQLTRRPDGRLQPTGPWTITSSETRAAATPATRRTGTVSPGVLQQAATSSTGSGPATPRAHESGAESEAWLPSSVRASLAKAVPVPVEHMGTFLLWTCSGGAEQVVDVLRLAGDRAVVVHASRPDRPEASWSVTQLIYDLEPQNLRLEM